jgi:hypothetical protein
MDEHLFGKPMSIRGFVPMSGAERHPLDTESTLMLTLYNQAGEMQTMPVKRSRDMEIFQEWLRRFDRYTPNPPSLEWRE